MSPLEPPPAPTSRRRSRRVLGLNALLGIAIAWFCWVGAHVGWQRPDGDGPAGGPGYGHLGGGRGGAMLQQVDVSWLAVPFLVLVAAGVALRWWRPRWAFLAAAVGVGGFFATTAWTGPVLLALALTVYPMAVTLPVRRWVWLLALLVPVVLVAHRQDAYLGLLDPVLYAQLVTAVAFAVLPALVALLRRGRREAVLRDRAEDRRRTAYEERLRIAREVHDVVGHSLSVVTMQAGVALHVLEKHRAAGESVPVEVSASLEAIRRTSRDALVELRTTLGMFRDEAADPRAPVAGLDRLDDLVGALRAAGRRIDVDRPADDGPPLPAAVDQAAFRIVQEALTNVVRHAGDARASVRVVREPAALVVEVADDGLRVARVEEGNGIRGMRERARALGGSVSVTTGPQRGLLLRAELPLAPVAAEPVVVP